jgi:hypothetical protein
MSNSETLTDEQLEKEYKKMRRKQLIVAASPFVAAAATAAIGVIVQKYLPPLLPGKAPKPIEVVFPENYNPFETTPAE